MSRLARTELRTGRTGLGAPVFYKLGSVRGAPAVRYTGPRIAGINQTICAEKCLRNCVMFDNMRDVYHLQERGAVTWESFSRN